MREMILSLRLNTNSMKHKRQNIKASGDLFAQMMALRPRDDHDEELWVFSIIMKQPTHK